MAASEEDRPGEAAEDDAVLESLIARCLDRMQRGHAGDPLETLCAEHPERADQLRARMQKLRDLGIVTDHGSAADAVASDTVPEAIAGYEIVARLGSGGMGDVWLARQTQPVRRDVALKVIKRGMDTNQIVRRFAAERQALAQLEHEGIAKVFDAGSTDSGRPYFAMEYVAGLPITDYCDEKELHTEARLTLFASVCDAVQHAHQKGIIHRDLKPSNVLVRGQNGDGVPKVIDFGLAKATEPHLAEQTLFTQLGQIVGTPEYMSPEQASAGEVDTRTDVYSLGAVLYELLVGELPFESEKLRSRGLSALQQTIREVEAERPSTKIYHLGANADDVARRRGVPNRAALRRRVAGDLDWITMRALEKDRDRRYQSVSELAGDVRRHLRHEPVLAGPPTVGYRVAKFVRRYRGAVSAVAALLVVGVLGLVFFAREYQRAERHLSHFDSLSEADLLEGYIREARDDLWPAHPSVVPAMDAWLAKARTLVAGLPTHERTLRELRRNYGTSTSVDGVESWEFEQYRLLLLHDQLVALTTGLAALAADDGPIQQVEERRTWAATLTETTIEAHREAWERAVREVADPELCPPYQGQLRLTPQIGLIPLGPDPQSRLYEFAFADPSGLLPVRSPDGVLSAGPSSHLVFVLLPAASVLVGSCSVPGEPNHDPYMAPAEGPPRRAELDAFFVSKYEVMQSQWQRFTGSNPSWFAHDGPLGLQIEPTHPVERVSWRDATRWLARLDLRLPTEAQWEYAARGGSSSVWWCGDDLEDLYLPAGNPAANLRDQQCRTQAPAEFQVFDEYDDGYSFHAPVMSCRPNGFGLHHVLGNVWEWCRDPAPDYHRCSPLPGDGYQAGPDLGNRTWRGGSFYSVAARARCSVRLQGAVDDSPAVVGVRPVRRLDP